MKITILIATMFACPFATSGLVDSGAYLSVEHDGNVVTLEWTPVYQFKPVDVYLGAKKLFTAPSGVQKKSFALDHFGVGLFTVRQGNYGASAVLDMGRILFDPVEGVDKYILYLSTTEDILDAESYDVGLLTDISIVTLALSPGHYWVWVCSGKSGGQSKPSEPVEFDWRNALVAP